MTEPREDEPDPAGRRTGSPRLLVLAALIAAFVLVMGGTAAGAYLVFDRTAGKDDAKPSSERTVTVFLCLKSSGYPSCKRQTATDQQKDEIRKRLESTPKVRSVAYRSQEEAWTIFKKKFADDKDLVGTVRPEDLPDSFEVRVEDDEAARAVKAALTGVPGVEAVVPRRRRP